MAIAGKREGAMAAVQKGGGAGPGFQQLTVLMVAIITWIATPASSQITFIGPPRDAIVALGSPVRFDCEISSSSSVSVGWEKEGVSIFPQGRFQYLDNSSLLVDPTQAGDNGTYACVVTDLTNQQAVERSATLRFAYILNSFELSPEDQTVNSGVSLLLFCTHAGSLPAASITWTLNDDIITTSSRIFISQSVLSHVDPPQVSSSLGITSVQASDAGSYVCIASNPLLPSSTVASSPGTLTVRAPPSPPNITRQPDDVVVITGQSASFSCSAGGEPLPSIRWSRNNVELTPSSQVTITTSMGTSMLTITGVQEVNAGSYRCLATNSQGSVISQPATLQLASISVDFELQPLDTVAVIGNDGILHCLPPPSLPPAVVTWTKNSAQLTGSRFQVLENGSLMISGVLLEDQDDYRCVATNPLLGVARTSQAARLTAIGEPSIIPATVTVNSGQSVTLLCSARGIPAPTFSWFKGETQLLDSDPRLSVSGGTLRISNIVVEDRGYYTCRAEFTVGARTETRAVISVRSPPEFMNTDITLTTTVGSQILLPCDIIVDPIITFAWQFNGITINPASSAGVFSILSNGSLVISSVANSHEGVFTCVATNTLGVAEGNVTLTVNTPPTITPSSTSVVVTEGGVATLTCTATGDPVPVQTWNQNGSPLTSGGRYQISGDGRVLTVQGVSEAQDEGVFTCHASNEAGADSADITVSVQVLPSVTATPTTQQLSAGETVSFDCIVTGDPTPQLRWLDSASMDVTSLSDSRIQVLTNGTLVISDLRASDQQQFVCEATNAVGQRSATVSLLVTVAPSVSLPSATTAVQGNSLTLDCNPIGQPSPTMTWYKDNVQLTSGGRVSIDGEGRLMIGSVVTLDGGSYRCEASSSVGVASATTTLTVLVAPIIQPQLLPTIANETFQTVLDCVASGNPPPTTSWFFNSAPLPSPSVPRITQAANGSLVFSPVEKGDEGAYICRASNDVGMESATFQLRVQVAPVVTATVTSITVIEGGVATLTCTATGDPVPIQTWNRNGTPLTSGGRYQISGDGRVLTVQGVSEAQDEGVFTCHASNNAGADSADITVSVLIPPQFSPLPSNSTAVEGEQHSLTCMATGDPAPTITWSLNNDVVSSQGTLMFTSVARGDSGLYTCTATSIAGSVSSEVYLDVQYPPSILQSPISQTVALNSTAQLVCVADGNPSPQISWLLDDMLIQGATESTYVISMVTASSGGQYTCTATNSLGTVTQRATLTVLFPPSSPNLLFASATSSSTFSVQWAASANNGGSPITAYVIEYRDSSLSSAPYQMSRIGSSMTSAQLDGLTAFVNYDIRVRAENAVGLSAPSNTLSGRTHPAAPSTPGNFRVTSSDSTSLSLAWDVPSPLNGQLAAYQLDHTNEITSQRQTNLLFFVTEFRLTGLQSGVTYRIELRASTRGLLGESLWGPFAVLRVRDGVELEVPTEAPPTTAPPTTQAETTTQKSTTTVMETTTAIEPTSQVGVTTTAVATTTEEDMDTTTPPTTVTEATTTMAAVLNPPTVAPSQVLLHVPVGSSGQVEVIWREPSSGLGTFIGYQIIISPAPPPPLTTPILQTPPTASGPYFYSITGLANFTTYTITVATYNDDGVGPMTAQSTVTTPEALPGPPLNVEAVALSSQTALTISWSPPSPRNGVILRYLVEISAASTNQAVQARTVMVGSSLQEQERNQLQLFTGLDLANVRYQIDIYASTSVGQGPSSIPVFAGTDSGIVMTTAEATPMTTVQPQDTTSEATPTTTEDIGDPQDTTSEATLPVTTDNMTSSSPMTTDTPTQRTPVRNDEYYIVRIVPPVVVALFILAIIFAVAMGCIFRSRHKKEGKKGQYSFGDHVLKNKQALDDEGIVAGDDDVETASYHVKDALDANFTYSYSHRQQPPSHQYGQQYGQGRQGPVHVRRGQLHETTLGGGGGGGMRGPVNQPYTGGQSLDGSSWYPSSLGGRDALQEPDSRPDSGELDIMPAQIRDSGSTLGSQSEGSISSAHRLPYHPGDPSYAEVEAIRARKAQERGKRSGADGQYPSHQPQLQQRGTFDPNLGFSNGGIMETRIGAVGDTRGNIPPEASAQMY